VNKYQIRKKILKLRKSKNLENNHINFKELMKFVRYQKNIKIVGGYFPFNKEIDDLKILQALEKKKYLITLPKIKKNNQMDFFEWSFTQPLIINKYGIPEPISNNIRYPDLLLVPLVAYDKKFNRIGYGGGYYDRFLKKISKRKKIVTVGLAYSFQKVINIPINDYDIKLDYIITDKKY
tara:strand:+ start:1424 stop:1960 length:537 start_codon:yes stop_codon:yes gene_type:complete